MPWANGQWKGGEPTVEELAGDDAPECACCGAAGVPLSAHRLTAGSPRYEEARGHREPPWSLLCGLCANTMTGVWHEYPHQHDADMLELMRTVCHVGNAVLRALAEANRGPTP